MKRSPISVVLGSALAAALIGCGAQARPPVTPVLSATASPSPAAIGPPSLEPSSSPEPSPAAVTAPAAAPAASPSAAVRPSTGSQATVAPAVEAPVSCGTDSYRNVDGICVHRPVVSSTVPAGATAVCRDGTYSFSLHHQGTCSGHGGVARWVE
jgi:hypothetical protein